MASTSGAGPSGQDEDLEEDEELERFDDFTLASSWERFISEIEAICRQWQSDGPKNLLKKGAVQLEISQKLYVVKFELKYAMRSYSMEYYFETDDRGKHSDWNSSLHDLQLCFGVREFLVCLKLFIMALCFFVLTLSSSSHKMCLDHQVISPQSASGVVLDAPEACKLLSAIAIALSNSSR
uniref:Rab3 GTPase-activating protein catalytic subunit isoform X1 n=1 Tax=Rhizophora mucronata TaxID=61149 RepID=A0A2P2M4U0_RHIMU